MVATNGRKASQGVGGVVVGDEALAAAVLGRFRAAVRDAYRVADRIDAMLNAGGLERLDWSRGGFLDRRTAVREFAAAATMTRYALDYATSYLPSAAMPDIPGRSEVVPESARNVIEAMRAVGEELLRLVDDYNALGWAEWQSADKHRDVRRRLLTAGVVLSDAAEWFDELPRNRDD